MLLVATAVLCLIAGRSSADTVAQGVLTVGEDSRVRLDHRVLDGLADFTIEFWILAAGGSGAILSAANDREDNELLFFDLDELKVYVKGRMWNTRVALNDSLWHHVAVARQGASGTVSVYVDGLLKGRRSMPAGALDVAEGGLWIGQEQDEVGGRFEADQALVGRLDELRVWDTVRPVEAIEPLIHTALLGDEDGLAGYWRFEGASADGTVPDRSGNGRPLLLGGGAALGETGVPLGSGFSFIGGVLYGEGERSFVDQVVSFEPGAGVEPPYDSPLAVLGPPDAGDELGYVALGDGGVLTLRFVDNALVDQDALMGGLDLFIYEIGNFIEGFDVAISADGEEWIELGRGEGQPTGIDIQPFVEEGGRYSYVRLTDDGISQSNAPFAGADIDAIGAIGSVVFVGRTDFNADGAVDFSDLFFFASHFGRRRGQADWDERYDLFSDGVVDFEDLGVFARLWPGTGGSAGE